MRALPCIFIALLLYQCRYGTTTQDANTDNSLDDANAPVPVVAIVDSKDSVYFIDKELPYTIFSQDITEDYDAEGGAFPETNNDFTAHVRKKRFIGKLIKKVVEKVIQKVKKRKNKKRTDTKGKERAKPETKSKGSAMSDTKGKDSAKSENKENEKVNSQDKGSSQSSGGIFQGSGSALVSSGIYHGSGRPSSNGGLMTGGGSSQGSDSLQEGGNHQRSDNTGPSTGTSPERHMDGFRPEDGQIRTAHDGAPN